MTDLSPAAQAVLNAVREICPAPADEIAAAALRAVADQVVPESANGVGDKHDEARADQWTRIRNKILAIAAELDNNSTR